MANEQANVLNLDLTAANAKKILTNIKRNNPEKIYYLPHAEERMEQRGITRTQVEKCIEHGRIVEGPYRDTPGNWKMNLECVAAGDRITVVGVLDRDDDGNYVLIVTTY